MVREHVATVLDGGEVAHLEGDMVHPGPFAAQEIDGVVIRITAHEYEEVAIPVRYLETENAFIEIAGLLHVRNDKCAVAEFDRPDAHYLLVGREIIPLREHFDGRSLVVLEGEQLGRAGKVVAVNVALDPVLR